jgi:hypothetical protein
MAIGEVKNDNTIRLEERDRKSATLTQWKRDQRSENYLAGEINRALRVERKE